MVVVGLFLIIMFSNMIFIPTHGYLICKVVFLYFDIKRIGTGRGYAFLTNNILPALLLINAGVILYVVIYYFLKDRVKEQYKDYNYNQKFKEMESNAYKAMKLCGVFIYMNFSLILSLAIYVIGVGIK